jgi:ABC-type multidrug transport system fused ATPase/permease subunit
MLLRPLLRLLTGERPFLLWWVLLVALSVVLGVLEVAGSAGVFLLLRLLSGGITSDASSIEVIGVPLLPTTLREASAPMISVALLVLLVARAALMFALAYLGGRLSRMAGVRIARGLLDGYLHLPFAEIARRRPSDMVRDTFVSTEQLHERATRPMTALVTDALVAAGLIVALLVVNPLTTLVVGAFLSVALLTVQRLVRPRLRQWSRQSQAATSNSIEVLQQALTGVRDIRLLGQEQRFLAQHDRERRNLARYRYLANAARSIPRSILEIALISAIVVVMLVFIGSTEAEQATILPVLGTFAYVGFRLQPILNRLVSNINEIRSSQGLIEDLLAEHTGLAEAKARLPLSTTLSRPGGSNAIALSGVSFAYPNTPDRPSRSVLEDVDIEIPEGGFVGIVGPTGSGKSTLLDIIVGLLPPDNGEVRVGGVLLDTAPRWWWSRLGVVSQSVYLAPGSILDNVAFGSSLPGRDVGERVWESLEIAQLGEFVQQLPNGVHTRIGEGGVGLSGGQRQRLAIARAVFRDPPVLVLDEGTSALDGGTESRVLDALRNRISAGEAPRTLIVVTHRARLVADADHVIEVHGARAALRPRTNRSTSGLDAEPN